MTESEAYEALKALDSRVKLLAFIWKDGGEDRILEL
jgi:hypothetical protein